MGLAVRQRQEKGADGFYLVCVFSKYESPKLGTVVGMQNSNWMVGKSSEDRDLMS